MGRGKVDQTQKDKRFQSYVNLSATSLHLCIYFGATCGIQETRKRLLVGNRLAVCWLALTAVGYADWRGNNGQNSCADVNSTNCSDGRHSKVCPGMQQKHECCGSDQLISGWIKAAPQEEMNWKPGQESIVGEFIGPRSEPTSMILLNGQSINLPCKFIPLYS